jgi:hypothetical protein
MEGSDILTVGECPTVVQDNEKAVFSEACEFIWARALRAEGITDGTLKVTMTQTSVDQLYYSVRRDLCRMLGRYEPGLLSCPELFFMVVNHFYHSESGREFRLPLGAAPVHRRNKKGRVSVVLQGTGEFHGNKWLNSLMLCLLNMSGMAGTAAWLPIFVTVPVIQQAMMNMRRRQLEQTLIWRNAGWCYRRVFYGALFVLLAEEMGRGGVPIRRRPWCKACYCGGLACRCTVRCCQLGFFIPSRSIIRLSKSRVLVHGSKACYELGRVLRFINRPSSLSGEPYCSFRENVVHGRLLETNEALLLLPLWSVLEEANHILDCEL